MNKKFSVAMALSLGAFVGSAVAADQYFMRVPAPGQCAVAGCSLGGLPTSSTPAVATPTNPTGYFTAVTTADFGKIQVGSSATRQFTFTNTSAASLTNAYVSVAGTGFSMGSPGSNTCGLASRKATIAPGATCKVSVGFSPKAVGSQAGTLTLNSTDLMTAAPTYALTGAGGQAVPVLGDNVKAGINFGTVVVGTPASITFTLANQGDVPLNVTRNRIGRFGTMINDQEVLQYTWMNWADGSITDTCPSAGSDSTAIQPGQSCSFTVTLAPKKLGTFSDSLNIPTSVTTISIPLALIGK